MKELTVVDLFAGIGGFSYGLHNASPMFKTVAFAEIDQFCQKVLKKNFGNVKIYEDVRDVRIEQPVFLVCGGFPCQGFSVAGLQRGTKDNRYLWPEMFDVIKHTKPRWVIAENVRGIVNVEDGMAFNKVHTDLESEGYEVQAFNIPAAAKGAWHRRERIWFVACNPDVVYPHDFRYVPDSNGSGHEGRHQNERPTKRESEEGGMLESEGICPSESDVPDSGSKRLKSSRATGKMGSKSKEEEGRRNQSSFLSTSSSNVPDSESERTGEPGEPHKEKRLEGGNAAQSNGGGAVDVPDSESKGLSGRRGEESYQNENRMEQGEERQQGKVRSLLERCDGISNDVPDSNEGNAQAGRERQRGVCEKDKVEGQPDNAARPRQALPDTPSSGLEEHGHGETENAVQRSEALPDSESIGHGGGNSKERGTEQWQLQQKEQKRNEMGSETEGRSELPGGERNVSDSKVEGLEGRIESSPVSGKDEKPHAGNENGTDVSDSTFGNAQSGHSEHRIPSEETEEGETVGATGTGISTKDVWNTQGTGFKSRTNGQGKEEHGGASPPGEQCEGDWSEIIAQFRGVPDGVSSELDKTRTNRLKSLGNAIVSQIAEEIGRAIIKAELRNERL